ncbi:FMN reductase NtaB [Podospora australis]|uniref:FMN reductase NtaB n=1 Tax=Podospora australis TaxID=1536484 RepID=A0AAN6WXI3_9PEZI|nr:FMN reductase NtaB [Podospora australis]
MSFRRNLVGSAAESAHQIFTRQQTCRGMRVALRLRSRRVVVAAPSLSTARNIVHQQQSRPFHSTSPSSRAFEIAPPKKPSVHPHSSTTDISTPLPEQFRTLMRLVTHSVVVCTSTFPSGADPASQPPAPRAMTMSSFTSLALRPTPVVSFNIATPSRTFDAVEASRLFNIHVLADDASGARVADWLAQGNAAGLEVFKRLEEECGCTAVTVRDNEKDNEPVVLRGPGVLYVLRCRLLDQPAQGLVKVRDHVIVLGEVMEIIEVSGGENNGQDDRFGLLYTDRTYRQLGNCITPKQRGKDL